MKENSSAFTHYHGGYLLIEKASNANEHLFNTIETYMEHLSQELLTFNNNIASNQVPTSKTQIGDTSFSRSFNSIILDLFSNPNISDFSAQTLKTGADQIRQFAATYISQINEQLEKIKQNFAELDTTNKNRITYYDAYIKAHDDLEQAFQFKSSKLSDFKRAYVQSKNLAIHSHNILNEKILETSKRVEELYILFENLERERSRFLKKILNDFIIQPFETFAYRLSTKNKELCENLKCWEPDADYKRLVGSYIKSPTSDDRFQLIPIIIKNGINVTNFIDMMQLVKASSQSSYKLYEFLGEFDGKNDFLSGKQNEVVIGLKEERNKILCMNINESVGFVPTINLKPFVPT